MGHRSPTLLLPRLSGNASVGNISDQRVHRGINIPLFPAENERENPPQNHCRAFYRNRRDYPGIAGTQSIAMALRTACPTHQASPCRFARLIVFFPSDARLFSTTAGRFARSNCLMTVCIRLLTSPKRLYDRRMSARERCVAIMSFVQNYMQRI